MASRLYRRLKTETMVILFGSVCFLYVLYITQTLNKADISTTQPWRGEYMDTPLIFIAENSEVISVQEKQYRALDTPVTACKSDRVQNVIIIVTSPLEDYARSVVRNSWVSDLSKNDSNIGYLFLIGTGEDFWNPEHQVLQYMDILSFSVKYSIQNTSELLLLGLEWVIQNCKGIKYITKVHGDIFVNTLRFNMLPSALPDAHFFGGSCMGVSKPNRNKVSPFYVTRREYNLDIYPPMCSTAAYVMSVDVARSLFQAVDQVPYFRLEDVYVGQLLFHLKILPRNIVKFVGENLSGKGCHNEFLIIHEEDLDHMTMSWRQITRCNLKNRNTDKKLVLTFSELKNFTRTFQNDH